MPTIFDELATDGSWKATAPSGNNPFASLASESRQAENPRGEKVTLYTDDPTPPGYRDLAKQEKGGPGYFDYDPKAGQNVPYGKRLRDWTPADVEATYGPPVPYQPSPGVYMAHWDAPVVQDPMSPDDTLREGRLRDLPGEKPLKVIDKDQYDQLIQRRGAWDQAQSVKRFQALPPEQKVAAAAQELASSSYFRGLPPDQQQALFLKTAQTYAPEWGAGKMTPELLTELSGVDFSKGAIGNFGANALTGFGKNIEELRTAMTGDDAPDVPQAATNPLRPYTGIAGRAVGGAAPIIGLSFAAPEAVPYVLALQGYGQGLQEGSKAGYSNDQTKILAAERAIFNALIGKVIPGEAPAEAAAQGTLASAKQALGGGLKTALEVQGIGVGQAAYEAKLKEAMGLPSDEAFDAAVKAAANGEGWAQALLFGAVHAATVAVNAPKGEIDVAKGGTEASNPFGSEADLPKPADRKTASAGEEQPAKEAQAAPAPVSGTSETPGREGAAENTVVSENGKQGEPDAIDVQSAAQLGSQRGGAEIPGSREAEGVAGSGQGVEPARPSPAADEGAASGSESEGTPPTEPENGAQLDQGVKGKMPAQLRDLADAMDEAINKQFNPGVSNQNPTARRARIAEGMYKEGESLQKVQKGLRALADAHERGDIPEPLKGITTRAQVEELLRRNGYPAPYANPRALRELLDQMKGKKGLPEIRSRIGHVGEEGRIRMEQAEAVKELLSLAKKAGIKTTYLNIDVASADRLAKAGIGNADTWKAAKEHLEGMLAPSKPDPMASVKKMERDLIGVKIPGFFPTPKPLIDEMLSKADIRPGMKVLEPSAGKGDIADAIREAHPDSPLTTVEVNHGLRKILEAKGHKVAEEGDFLHHAESYDRIVMNPPFENGQDIDHVRWAYDSLKPGGRLVAIMSEGPFSRMDRKASEFREWLAENGGISEKNAEGAFTGKESFRQTGVATRTVVLDKPSGESLLSKGDALAKAHSITFDGIQDTADPAVKKLAFTDPVTRSSFMVKPDGDVAEALAKVRERFEAAKPKEPPLESKTTDTPGAGDQRGEGKPNDTAPESRPIAELDAKDPAQAQAIVDAYVNHLKSHGKQLDEASIEAANNAYRTLLKPVVDPTGAKDIRLWAMPGQEEAMQQMARDMAKEGAKAKADPHAPRMAKLKKAPPAKMPKPFKDKAATMEAVLDFASNDPRIEGKWATNGYRVLEGGKRLAVTDGHRAVILSAEKGHWGEEGLFDRNGKAVEDGVFPDAVMDQIPGGEPIKNIRIDQTLRRLRQIEHMTTDEARSVLVLLNDDGSLGFAIADHNSGMAEVGVQAGREPKTLGAVDPTYLRELLEMHAKMSPPSLSQPEFMLNWESPKKPLFIDNAWASAEGEKIRSILMPVDMGGASFEKVREAMKEPGLPFNEPETEAEAQGGDVAGLPSHSLRQPSQMSGGTDPQITAAEIIKSVEGITGTPVRIGHGLFGQRKALGWFDRGRDVIRQQVANDIMTAAHEAGHALHEKLIGWNSQFPPAVTAELREAGKQLYGSRRPNAGYAREGVAEFVARYMGGDPMTELAETKHWFDTTILPAHPEFAQQWHALKEKFDLWNSQGAAARVAAHVQRIDHTVFGQARRGYEYLAGKLWQNFRTAFSTDQASLEDLMKRMEAERGTPIPFEQNPAKMRQSLKGTYAGTARAFIVDAALGRTLMPVGKSLADVLKPIKARMDDFVVYAVARRSLDLLDRSINPGITEEDAQHTAKLLKNPEFDAALDGVTAWSNHLIDYLVGAGGLSKDAAQTIRDLNPVYVPFKRYFDETQLGGGPGGPARGMANLGSGVKRIKGSGRQVIDPLESLALQAEYTVKLANKLDVARSIIDLAERTPGMAKYAEKVATPKEATNFKLEEIAKQLETAGIDLSGANLDQVLSVFDDASRYFGKDNIVTLWRNGRREFWELHPDLYRVVTEMDKDQPGVLLHTLAKFKRGVQLGATGLSASFSFIKNPLRDAMTHAVFSETKDPGRIFYGWFDGLQRELRGDAYAKLWKRAGGELTTIMGQDRAAAGRMLEESLAETRGEKATATLRHPVDALRQFFGTFEAAPRISEFYTVLKDLTGGARAPSRPEVLQALLASKDVTVDFTRAGTVGQALNMMVPFFNAGVQGSGKFIRTFSGIDGRARAVRAWARALPIVLASSALWWMAKDEDWYQKRDDWEKEQYWLMSPDGGKHVLRIPKGDIGFAFGTLPAQALQALHDKDPHVLGEAMVDGFKKFSPLASPLDAVFAMVKPAVEAESNYDSFRGRAIDTETDMGKLPEDRYSKWTTETAKALGTWLHASPKRIEHLMSGYTGGLGLDMARMAEWVAGARKGGETAADTPIAGTLFSRDPAPGGAWATKLHERLTALEQKKNSKKASDGELAEYYKLSAISHALSALRKAIDQTESEGHDTTSLEKQMDDLAKNAMKK